MRGIASCALMIALLLAGCSQSPGKAEEKVLEFQSDVAALEGLELKADVAADMGDEVYRCTLAYEYIREGGGEVTVLSPENIAGISARLDSDGVSILFEGILLEAGRLDESGLSPVSALPAMVKMWREGYINECAYVTIGDRECVYAALDGEDGSDGAYQELWFDKTTFLPVRAAIVSEYRAAITAVFDFGEQ